MKPQFLLGVILIIVGVLILIYQGFTYTKKTNVVDTGPVKIDAEKKETIPIQPLVGVVCLGGGIFLTVLGSRKGA